MEPDLQYAVLNTLCYFQVFEYPLTKEEIWKYLSVKSSLYRLEEALTYLKQLKLIFQFESFYCLKNDTKLIYRRKQGNKIGKAKLKKAMFIARFLGLFPFVETVCISGSLSKDFALRHSDLDYFIITAPNRLWTARNFMHLFRKLSFTVNAQNLFCMNYYISMSQLEINPKNIYTAIELSSLKPAYVHKGWDEINKHNSSWLTRYLPNSEKASKPYTQRKKSIMTRFVEYIINALGGDKIEEYFYKTTMRRWAKKWAHQNYDVEQCMLSADFDFNTPVNYPENLPEVIIQQHQKIYKEVKIKLLNATFGFASSICYN